MRALEPGTDDGAPSEAGVVYVIQSEYHYRDADNYPKTDERLLEDEGWFADPASAAFRCEQLNAQHRALYDMAMARARRERDAKIHAAESANREAAVLRANGMHKPDVKVPSPFKPTPFESFQPGHGYTTYEVLEIRRSDHDGIARARETGAGDGTPVKDEAAESDTTEVVVSGTA